MTLELRDPLVGHSRVAVLGLGASGRAATRLLARLGKSVIASDSRDDASTDGVPAGTDVRLGGNETGDATAVVVSPGLNPEWPENRERPALRPIWDGWRRGEIEVWSEVELAIAAWPRPVLTVGGTDGKSTTAALCAHVLDETGFPVLLGGNSWTAFSDVVLGASDERAAIVEVSAFQLWQGHRLRPDVAVMTNIALDHLDHYDTADDYVAAKRQVIAHLGADQLAVLWLDDPRLRSWIPQLREQGVSVAGYGADPSAASGLAAFGTFRDGGVLEVVVRGEHLCVDADALRIPGAHNRRNALAALLGTSWLRDDALPSAGDVAGALKSFSGLPHRIEFVREIDGARWFNDSKATNVHAAVVGLRAMSGPVVAIVGGVDKQLDLAPLINALDDVCHHVVVIGGLRERLIAEAGGGLSIETADTLDAAVAAAQRAARPGDAVLLAPACSSFDMFRSFEHRGACFVDAVQGLTSRG